MSVNHQKIFEGVRRIVAAVAALPDINARIKYVSENCTNIGDAHGYLRETEEVGAYLSLDRLLMLLRTATQSDEPPMEGAEQDREQEPLPVGWLSLRLTDVRTNSTEEIYRGPAADREPILLAIRNMSVHVAALPAGSAERSRLALFSDVEIFKEAALRRTKNRRKNSKEGRAD